MTGKARENALLYGRLRDEQAALYDEYAKSCGLLRKTFLVLRVLFYAEDGLTQKQICARTFQSKQTVSLIVGNLLRAGRAAPAENRAGRRNRIIRLTTAGRAYAQEPVRRLARAEDAAMAMLAPEEQAQLIALSGRFTQNLTELVRGERDKEDHS